VFHRKITVDIGECMMGEVIRIANGKFPVNLSKNFKLPKDICIDS
jgi:hypothetical protein